MDHWDLRRLVFETLAETGSAPSPAECAARLGVDAQAVRHGLRLLHDAHALVLNEHGDAVRMAHPFSTAPMGFVVSHGDRMWWGGCTWDSFGISAALRLDVRIDTRCPGCGAELRMDVGPDRPPAQSWVAHLPRPARAWWDDVVDTCSRIRTYCSPGHVKDLTGQAVPITGLWRLAQPWYGDRLDPGYRPRPVAESQRLLEEAGFTGEFWRLPAGAE